MCALKHWSIKLIAYSVADPGFPIGGGTNPLGGHQPPTHTLFGKNVCENERNWSCWGGGGHTLVVPPLDLPMILCSCTPAKSALQLSEYFYRLRIWESNVFILSVCQSLCVCVCVCVCVCASVQAITFECLDTETSFLVWWYILTISSSNLSTMIIGSRSRSLW